MLTSVAVVLAEISRNGLPAAYLIQELVDACANMSVAYALEHINNTTIKYNDGVGKPLYITRLPVICASLRIEFA
jgi:hypothetical protein